MGVLDKIRKFKDHKPQRGPGSALRGIFHQFKDGPNILRLVGEFIEVRTHFIAPNLARGDRGLCQAEAFKRQEGKLPQIINCLDWDVAKEETTGDHKCPVCRLHEISRLALKENPTAEEKEFLEALLGASCSRINLKWNIIDRDDPMIVMLEGEKEIKVKGFKIATIGMEAWTDIEGIFDQCKADITDPDEGVDINVTKGNNGTRTTYSAIAVIEGKSLKVTPLTQEERAMKRHDLKNICGRLVEAQKIIDALHGDYRDLLDLNVSDEEETSGTEKQSKPPAKPAPVIVDEPPDVADADSDGLMDGPAQKKTAQVKHPVRKPAAG